MTSRVLMIPARGRILVRPQLGQCGNASLSQCHHLQCSSKQGGVFVVSKSFVSVSNCCLLSDKAITRGEDVKRYRCLL